MYSKIRLKRLAKNMRSNVGEFMARYNKYFNDVNELRSLASDIEKDHRHVMSSIKKCKFSVTEEVRIDLEALLQDVRKRIKGLEKDEDK